MKRSPVQGMPIAAPPGSLAPDIRLEAFGTRPYALPLRQPWTSARGTRTERRGWLIEIRAAGLCGYGDCAPLPEAGTEVEAAAEAMLSRWQAQLPGHSLADLLDPGWQGPYGAASGKPSRYPPGASSNAASGDTSGASSSATSADTTGASSIAALGDTTGPSSSAASADATGSSISALFADLGRTSSTPAAGFALESALTDLAARLAGVPLRRWLTPRAGDAVLVNATLGTLRDQTPVCIVRACQAGYQVLKLKVGLDAPETEIAHLQELATHLPPGASLRLDANGAWDYDQAARLIVRLNDLPIESLEEPLKVPDWQALASLKALARFPLALDESLHHDPANIAGRAGLPIARLLSVGNHAVLSSNTALAGLSVDRLQVAAGAPPVHRLVLKPAAVGGLRRTLFLARKAADLGLEVVLTSLIESAAGLWPSLQLAAALSSSL
ncbi:MAG TPA: enolase C-terminal domain-like protein, partial [Chromatiaceae bacterium]|nr:enolase C-terminal domain-like protein [Chromatiaceae bacterium]